MKKITKKDRRRLTVLIMIFIPLLTLFLSNMFSYWSQIYKNIHEKKELDKKYIEVIAKEKMLQSEITKLHDDEYVAKYARERYLYSKDGELIIKLK